MSKIVEVCFSGVPTTLSYLAEDEVSVGWQVKARVKNSVRTGWVISDNITEEFKRPQLSLLSDKTDYKSVETACPCFPPSMLPVFTKLSTHHGCSLADTLDSCLPVLEPDKVHRSYFFARARENQDVRLSSKQAELYQEIKSEFHLTKSSSQLKALAEKKLIDLKPALNSDVYLEDAKEQCQNTPQQEWASLNKPQEAAVYELTSLLQSSQHTKSLLFGITGSGKTEVYLHLISKVLKAGKSVLVLVPEIALTPQLTSRLEARLKHPLGVLHSGVKKSEKISAWHSIYNGKLKFAIGARSAVFAPFRDLGLIIIDEEHDGSYKQGDGIRYNTKLVAEKRAEANNCMLLVGSATPSFETLYSAKKVGTKVFELPERANKKPLPEIEVVDTRKIKKKDYPSPSISPRLFEEMDSALKKGQQAAILYNRRGYSSFLQCQSCGEALKCPNCSLSLTFHKGAHRVICHLCGYYSKPPSKCEHCVKPAFQEQSDSEGIGCLDAVGSGTEKVHEEIAELFPNAKIVRLDRDTVVSRERMLEALNKMHSGEANVLVGTQMIAKGHDLPNVSIVGIINPDVGLHMPDFRSSEKTLQLLSQAAGRAGRGSVLGKVIIQTKEVEHPTIVAAANHRFKAFVRHELLERKACYYPPYSELLRVVVSNQDLRRAEAGAQALICEAKEIVSPKMSEEREDTVIYAGPARCAYEMINNLYRWHFTVRSPDVEKLSLLAKVINSKKREKGFRDLRVTVDVGAIDLL